MASKARVDSMTSARAAGDPATSGRATHASGRRAAHSLPRTTASEPGGQGLELLRSTDRNRQRRNARLESPGQPSEGRDLPRWARGRVLRRGFFLMVIARIKKSQP